MNWSSSTKFDGRVADLSDDVVAIVRPANIARHTYATAATVNIIDVSGAGQVRPVRILITDDGQGIDRIARATQALADMTERARRHRGSFDGTRREAGVVRCYVGSRPWSRRSSPPRRDWYRQRPASFQRVREAGRHHSVDRGRAVTGWWRRATRGDDHGANSPSVVNVGRGLGSSYATRLPSA